MLAGEVVRIRVNPKDAASVADIVRLTGFDYVGMSFSQACAIALSSLLETMRQSGAIPTRDGFDYSEVMKPFQMRKQSKRKLDIANLITSLGAKISVPAIPYDTADPEKQKRRRRYEELKTRKELDEINFTPADQEEFRPLVDEFFDFTIKKKVQPHSR